MWLKMPLLSLLLVILSPAQYPESTQAQAHVRELFRDLPPDSFLHDLVKGHHSGTGIRQDWMNDMEKNGIKAAIFWVKYIWDGGAKEMTVFRSRYFPDYGFKSVEFDRRESDARQVATSNDLDRKLRRVAVLEAEKKLKQNLQKAGWTRAKGTVYVTLTDNAWLPTPFASVATRIDPDSTELMLSASDCAASDGGYTYFYFEGPDENFETDAPRQPFDAHHLHRLLASGVDVNARDQEGETALSIASSNCNSAIVDALLRAGAKVNNISRSGWTPLMSAVQAEQLENVELLIQAGADVNVQAAEGWTALGLAVAKGMDQAVSRLLVAGADANARNLKGWTPLFFAAASHPSLVSPLLRAGASPNALDREGNSALIWAAHFGNTSAVADLISGGSDVNAKNKRGERALSEAQRAGRKDIIELLLSSAPRQ